MRAFLQSIVVCTAIAMVIVLVSITPYASTVEAGSKAKDRGRELFDTRGCAHCHGPAGVGGSEGPDLQLVRKRMNKAQIALQIHNGGKSMPAYGDTLSSAQIDDLVAYLRAKRKVIVVIPKATELAAPATAPSDPD